MTARWLKPATHDPSLSADTVGTHDTRPDSVGR